jgi:hypothetical protein
MPTPTKYTYSIQNAFPAHKVASDRLAQEIRDSSISIAFDYIGTSGDDCDVWFKDALGGTDETTLDGLVAAHSGEALPASPATVTEALPDGSPVPRTPDGKAILSLWPTEGTRVTIVTHNWCDKTTWYQKSVHVASETPTPTTPGTLYTLAHQNVIDTYHGKLWAEDTLGYRVAVTVNGVTKAEQDPHNNAGDYVVNYVAGTVTFTPPIAVDAAVLVTYDYATTSEFVIAPSPGKDLNIKAVETQFSVDVGMTDTVDFEAYGLVDVFAPQLMPGVPSGTKIPLGKTRYKSMQDFQAESNGALPTIPAVGGSSWRGLTQPTVVFPWNYAAMMILKGAAGMEVRLRLQHDVPFTGEYATATIYGLSTDS